MFSQFSFSIPRFGFGSRTNAGKIDIPPVKVHHIETSPDKRNRALKHLLKLNHANYSILYHNLQFHNHTPHILGSAYLLDGSADHLNEIYEDSSANEGHEPWKESPSEIALHDYRDFLGLREYQRAWVDFFEDQLVQTGNYEWRNVVMRFLFEEGSKQRPNPISMVHCLVSGLGHPLIHLGYAFEIDSKEVAMEGMGLVATCYDPKFALLLESNLPKVANATGGMSSSATSDLFEILSRIRSDNRLDEDFKHIGNDNLHRILTEERYVSILLEYWLSWKVTDPKKQFEDSQRLAVAILLSTASDWNGHGYDFFLVHLLTTSHAVRIIIPHIDAKYHLLLVREWFLITLAIYIAQLRPLVSKEKIAAIDLGDKDWNYAGKMALEGKHKLDAHYVKGVRAIKEAAAVWGDQDQWFEKAAVKFAGEFDGWKGFNEEQEVN